MAITSIGVNPYYSTIGDSWLAQTNRIVELAIGRLPYDVSYEPLTLDGYLNYAFAYNNANNPLNILTQQSEDIQTAFNALNAAGTGLKQIDVRIDVLEGLAYTIQNDPDLTDTQIDSINEQINNTLQEINYIAKTQSYNNVPILDGEIEQMGVYVNIAGNNSIDITDAFNAATPEDLGLPRQGEAYVIPDNAVDFLEQVNNARSQVNKQLDKLNLYSESLVSSLETVRQALYAGSLASLNNPYGGIPGTMNNYNYVGNNLYLTLGAVSNNVMFNNDFYDHLQALLN